MRYTEEKLCVDVMARLGEITGPQSQASVSDIPGPADVIRLMVRSLLMEEGAKLIREATPELLGSGVPVPVGKIAMKLMPCGLYGAEVRLPGGVLRMVSARMEAWERSAVSLTLPEAGDWNRQWSANPGIAGCPEAPRAYLDSDGEGMLVRLIGSESEEDTLEWLGVWCVPEPDEEGVFEFPEALYPPFVERISLALR